MVSSGTVYSDLQSITSVFSNYDNFIADLSNSWKGDSHDNLASQAAEFSSQFRSVIQKQMSSFGQACDLYEQYINAKNSFDVAQANYNNYVGKDNTAASYYAQQMQDVANKANSLSSQIQGLLSEASSPKLEATPLKPAGPTSGGFVNYYQYNYTDEPYSRGTIKTSGCGPTSMAMVLTYLTGKEVTPVEMARKGNGRYTCSKGTVWTYFGDMAKEYGVSCEQMPPSTSNIINNLNAGKTLILSMKPGHFTKGGHFIVVRGVTEDGNLIVSDPNSEERSNQTWDPNLVAGESAQIWALS